MKKRNQISQTKRQIIFARDGWACCYCGNQAFEITYKKLMRPMRLVIIPVDSNGKPFEIDHIIPVVKGGDNSFNNLATACWGCNHGKADKPYKPRYYFKIDLGTL